MRNYVINFFTCEHCKRHFEEATRDIDTIKDNQEGVLYLWVSTFEFKPEKYKSQILS